MYMRQGIRLAEELRTSENTSSTTFVNRAKKKGP
jgi:hypothetical protein